MCCVYSPEPLYQTYRAAVLSEELWGVGEDGGSSPTNAGEAPTFPRPPGPRNTLWQELPAVRASGLLDTLSPQERRMQEVGTPGVWPGGAGVGQECDLRPRLAGSWAFGHCPALPPQSLFEVVTSEASYLRSLRLLTDTFVLSQALRDTLTPRDHHTLFSNVQRVQGVSERSVGSRPLSKPGPGLRVLLSFLPVPGPPFRRPSGCPDLPLRIGRPGSLPPPLLVPPLLQVSRDVTVPCALFPPHQRPV